MSESLQTCRGRAIVAPIVLVLLPLAPLVFAGPPAPPSPVRIPGGRFTMGGGERPEENPAHRVVVKAFAIDPTEVTVARFAKFIAATKPRTEAEKWGWSGVFDLNSQVWKPVKGATWKRAGGPKSRVSAPQDPVTHVSWNDAQALCAHEKGRLPTEAEWEYAARDHFLEHGPKSEDVRCGRDVLRPNLLRRHVGRGAHEFARLRRR